MDSTRVVRVPPPAGASPPRATPAGAGQLNGRACALTAAEVRSRAAPRGKPRTREGCQDAVESEKGLTVALRQARDRSETASRAKHPLLAGAHRDLREPLTAML